jgi:tRNA nucleotidyltransferase (CCA-adding enzyme)
MKLYIVGGAVRDRLLGQDASDRDWVAVGSSPAELLALGYKPVGKDFPVFLHPVTGEEVALARTERKSAPGYQGFVFHAAPEVTLEQDLARRDLTLNAIAEDEDGQLIDPHGGQRDIDAQVLRHVSPAFAEDPVRLLRLARFAARWPHFSVAPETMTLAHQMVQAGEVDALVPERVWQELARGLMAERPSRMLNVLRECGALARLLPEVDALYGVPQPPAHHPEIDSGLHTEMALDMAAALAAPLAVRFALLCHDLGKALTPRAEWPRHIGHDARGVPLVHRVAERWRVPAEARDLAVLLAREHIHLHQSGGFGAEALLRLFERCDAIRRPERFALLLQGAECDARGRAGLQERAYEPAARRPAGAAAERGAKGPEVGRVIGQARRAAIAQALPTRTAGT